MKIKMVMKAASRISFVSVDYNHHRTGSRSVCMSFAFVNAKICFAITPTRKFLFANRNQILSICIA